MGEGSGLVKDLGSLDWFLPAVEDDSQRDLRLERGAEEDIGGLGPAILLID